MSDILLVTSSALGEFSVSRAIAQVFIDAVIEKKPSIRVLNRDATTIPHVNLLGLSALKTPVNERTAEQRQAADFADQILTEVEHASVIVITAPMYSFTIPSSLKAWIEYLNRPGRAYIHDENGDRGLLVDKKVLVVLTRGSCFTADHPMNFQDNYLKTVLNFFGMDDVTFIIAENTASEEGKINITEAKKQAGQFASTLF